MAYVVMAYIAMARIVVRPPGREATLAKGAFQAQVHNIAPLPCQLNYLAPRDPESAGFHELRPGRPPSIQGQIGPWGALVGRPVCA